MESTTAAAGGEEELDMTLPEALDMWVAKLPDKVGLVLLQQPLRQIRVLICVDVVLHSY